MKIMTIVGTRPELIRLSLVIPLLDEHCTHCFVHTGQNYDPDLNAVFFRELGLRKPDHELNCARKSLAATIGAVLMECEKVMERERPDKVLILGDTNSALAAIIAKRKGIPVYHMEAGNRCFDDRVPEEVNRRIIDHVSEVLLPYTERSRANLLEEGISHQRIFVTGNPIFEVIKHYQSGINESGILSELGIAKSGYFLVTLHRSENIDIEGTLSGVIKALERLSKEYSIPVVFSLHPHAKYRLDKEKIKTGQNIIMSRPFGFFDFINLSRNARCVLSDSGTVPEECAIMNVPCVILREVTERPEMLEAGSSLLVGTKAPAILRGVKLVLATPARWNPPAEYLVENVSGKVARIILGERKSNNFMNEPRL